jgi:hypothetical protein
MTSVSESLEHPEPPVPWTAQVDRARRISQLVAQPSGFAFAWGWFAIVAAWGLLSLRSRGLGNVGILPERLRPPGVGLTALLAVPGLAHVGVAWWRNRWWPRFWLRLARGAAVALLPLWIPPPRSGGSPVPLLVFGFAAALNLIDHAGPNEHLRETKREDDGQPV